ncbi:MAG: hypothetical protein QOI79_4438 [Mycobacterium sp.]|nr:hypothetical protein [Mycobacterium sp.]
MADVASRRLSTPPPRTLEGVALDNEYDEIEYGGLPVNHSVYLIMLCPNVIRLQGARR